MSLPGGIRSIETTYKGYRFRSRLEARWAVVLTELGVQWKYENEGYELSDGTRYLPDFWLPDQRIFLEIKGERASAEEKTKCYLLADESGCPVILLEGTPGYDQYPTHSQPLFHATAFFGWHKPDDRSFPMAAFEYEDAFEKTENSLLDYLSHQGLDMTAATQLSGRDLILFIVANDRAYYRSKYGREHSRWEFGNAGGSLGSLDATPGAFEFCASSPDDVRRALRAGQGARFEHGESGAR